MPSKEHKAEEMIGKLREAEIMLVQGGTTPEACRRRGLRSRPVTLAQGVGPAEGRPGSADEEFEKENARLRRAVSDLTLEKLILQEAARGELLSPARRRRCVDHIKGMLPVSSGGSAACSTSIDRRSPGCRGGPMMSKHSLQTSSAKQYGRYG